MGKKIMLTILIMGSLLLLVFPGNVNAATQPELKLYGTSEFFFANGTAITIEKRTDGQDGANITWNGGSQLVGKGANVFGGMHDNNTEVTTSITVNGGTVSNICGGGLHLSNTKSSKVVMNGGHVGGIMGAGNSSLTHQCQCSNATNWYAGNPKNSPCQTESATVIVNGGKIEYPGGTFGLLYGGGEGISNTVKSSLTITGGDLSTTYVTPAGSNGNTTDASLNIQGGNIFLVQIVNRGTLNAANIEITGGKIKTFYIGGEAGDSKVNGSITGGIKVEVSGNAEIEKMKMGTSSGTVIDTTTGKIKAEDIKVLAGTVKDNSAIQGSITTLYEVKIDNNTYKIEEGKTIKDLANYASIIKKDGYTFKGFKIGNADFDENTKITSNVELTTTFEKIDTVTDSKTEEKGEKDETPKTGSVDILLYSSAVAVLVSSIGILKIRKENK